ncbi:hypothetical protein R1flu_018832 [Riccia fluitans]|uniref:Uncharacterized protein n=1 Tax=Riccia fluitans TaxID=41844 RepID=A0ABD1ZKV2_9MARC
MKLNELRMRELDGLRPEERGARAAPLSDIENDISIAGLPDRSTSSRSFEICTCCGQQRTEKILQWAFVRFTVKEFRGKQLWLSSFLTKDIGFTSWRDAILRRCTDLRLQGSDNLAGSSEKYAYFRKDNGGAQKQGMQLPSLVTRFLANWNKSPCSKTMEPPPKEPPRERKIRNEKAMAEQARTDRK